MEDERRKVEKGNGVSPWSNNPCILAWSPTSNALAMWSKNFSFLTVWVLFLLLEIRSPNTMNMESLEILKFYANQDVITLKQFFASNFYSNLIIHYPFTATYAPVNQVPYFAYSILSLSLKWSALLFCLFKLLYVTTSVKFHWSSTSEIISSSSELLNFLVWFCLNSSYFTL